MTENNYGAYLSIRTPDGVLVSSSRGTPDEVLADLPGLQAILHALAYPGQDNEDISSTTASQAAVVGDFVPHAGPPVETGPPVVTGPQFHNQTEMTHEQIQAALNPQQVATPPVGSGQFDKCPKCSGPKSKWVPPGIAKATGNPYPGFFGCPINHGR